MYVTALKVANPLRGCSMIFEGLPNLDPRWQKQYRTSEKHSKTRVFGSDQKH